MAGPIQRESAARDVVGEVRGALERAIVKGGVARRIAEERLAPALSLVETVTAQLDKAREAERPLLTALSASQEDARGLLIGINEELWMAVGSPSSDAALSLLFPGGAGYYTEGSADEQADRMDLLAQLLSAGAHPKLSLEKARTAAKSVGAAAARLRAAVDAGRLPRARVSLLERASELVSQSAQNELALLRRRLKAEGVSDADIDALYYGHEAQGATNAEERAIPEGGLKLA